MHSNSDGEGEHWKSEPVSRQHESFVKVLERASAKELTRDHDRHEADPSQERDAVESLDRGEKEDADGRYHNKDNCAHSSVLAKRVESDGDLEKAKMSFRSSASAMLGIDSR